MEKNSVKRSRKRSSKVSPEHILAGLDLAKLGDGEVAYIRVMTSDEAQRMFPTIPACPTGLIFLPCTAPMGRRWH